MLNIFRKRIITLAAIFSVISFPASLNARPIVIELFTSQGCSSCPPADKFLGELAKNDGIIALSLHVDYWDDDGIWGWKDPHSSKDNTSRQRNYNTKNFKTNRNYTPQMVVEGFSEEIGSRKDEINLLLLRAKRMARNSWRDISIDFVKKDKDILEIIVGKELNDDLKAKQNIVLFSYDKVINTKVTNGENSGEDIKNHNVVKKIYNIGEWSGKEKSIIIDLKKIIKSDKIAVIVQDKNFRNINGANSLDL